MRYLTEQAVIDLFRDDFFDLFDRVKKLEYKLQYLCPEMEEEDDS